LRNEEPHPFADQLGIDEENPALEPQQQQTRKGLVVGMLGRTRPKDLGSRFAPEYIDRRSCHLVCKSEERHHDGNDDSFERSKQNHACEGDDAQRNSRRRILKIALNSAGLINPLE
jgi:hypothetical protein